ncbi:MAG: antibiotic biosynthesis monooxygenase [Gemmatimonadaceae bacterium]|nr:antibiotic biosynthesis monooxygenase [Gemmatimonadaceae bacterium]
MSDARFARTPEPPYYAVVFTSQRTDGEQGHGATAERMVELARAREGFLGVESARDAEGLGITVSYWSSLEAIRAWKADTEHLDAQASGRRAWYERYEVRICRVERAYRFER